MIGLIQRFSILTQMMEQVIEWIQRSVRLAQMMEQLVEWIKRFTDTDNGTSDRIDPEVQHIDTDD